MDASSRDSPAWQAALVEEQRRAGAALLGVADLGCLPENVRDGLPRALSIAVALDPTVVAGLADGPTRAYHTEYQRANSLLASLGKAAAATIEAHGFAARAGAVTVKVVQGDGTTLLPHKTVATLAGLGWIGHSAVLVTPAFGKAVRLTTVLTDAPWTCGKPVRRSRCGNCRACVDACPGGAVTGHPWEPGIARDRLFDFAACKKTASRLAAAQGIHETICGICILACPWTRRYLRRSLPPERNP
jgi:epoxyqueuosine reductase